MAECLIQDTTLDAIADAINAKTGGSSAMTPAEMVTEIGNIPTGGGGSLPSVISKIDGGTFTLADDEQASRYAISHSLGVQPKQIVVWTEDAALRESLDAVSQRYIMWAQFMLWPWVNNSTTTYAGFPVYVYRNTTGTASNTGSPGTNSSNVTNSVFTLPSTMYYKAGVEYKWVAYA